MYSNRYKVVHEQQARLGILGQEFHYKVQLDFKQFLFLGVKPNREMYLPAVIEEAVSLPGYEKHKTVSYYPKDGEEIVHHLYIKYSTSHEAFKAREAFREQDELHAELLDDILRGWYGYEKMCASPGETVGVLDIVGKVRYTDALSEELARSLLRRFGDPRIDFTDKCVKVYFSSMAEGIAACIYHGRWFVRANLQDPVFFYRIQLDKSEHFAELIGKCNQSMKALEAYRLDYFVPTVEGKKSDISYKNDSCGSNNVNIGTQRSERQFVRGRGGYRQRGAQNSRSKYAYQKFRHQPRTVYYDPNMSNGVQAQYEAVQNDMHFLYTQP